MKKKVICATICALAVALSTTGCADTTWAMKSGNITIPTGVYVYYLLNNAGEIEQQAEAAASSATTSAALAAAENPWTQTIGTTTASAWAVNTAISSCQSLVIIEQQSAARKITLTSAELASTKSNADSNYTSYQGMFTRNGISEASLERISKDMGLSQKLFDSYYSAKGDKAIPEATLDAYYIANFVHVKQIFINKNDSSNVALTGAALTAATAKANTAYAAAKKTPANFAALVKKYNEDPGMTSNPDGYIFSQTTATNQSYDQSFVSLAFSLKVGAVGMTSSDMGYFIEYKVPVDPKATTFAAQKENVLIALKGTEYTTMLSTDGKNAKIDQNKSALNHYDPSKLDFSTAS